MQDRFIPSRAGVEQFVSVYNVDKGKQSKFNKYMGGTILGDLDARLILPARPWRSHLGLYLPQNNYNKKRRLRSSSTPILVLDAPELKCNYYHNLLDWGKSGVVSVALSKSVWNWSHDASLFVTSDTFITSLRWNPAGHRLAVGLDDGTVNLFDIETSQQVHSFSTHDGGVNALAWRNDQFFSSGGDDQRVIHHDCRQRRVVHDLVIQTQQVCGLAWSPDGSTLAAGGNQNCCHILDIGTFRVRHVLRQHSAAVKALAWSPTVRNHLATGAGSEDKHIRIFDTSSGACLGKHNTGSQVCSLTWAMLPYNNKTELLSTHGYYCHDLIRWAYPTFQNLDTYKKHTKRVLYSAVSPDSSTVCSLGEDEQLCFWKIWPVGATPRAQKKQCLVSIIR